MESPQRSPEPTSHGGEEINRSIKAKKKARFLDFLRAAPTKKAILSRLSTLRMHAAAVPGASARLLRAPAFVRTVDWAGLRRRCAAWARHPMNAALLIWLAFVAAGVVFVFLLMIGALDSAIPEPSRRKRWTEVANQVLNALFTIMCVYGHPKLFHHLVLLLRWRPADAAELRAVYCKNADGPRRERLHVALVQLLLHGTCLAQYAYCALFWAFTTDTRPDWAVNLLIGVGLGAPIVAGLYMIYGPLGRKIVLPPPSTDEDEEAAAPAGSGRAAASRPEWAGGLFDLADDPTVAALSLSCTFCVFGWNMERLGFGNMYVHVVTFALLCVAPVLVFAVAALNIRDPTLGYLTGAAGALLSVLGLMYGGFWRAQMRRRFGLPAHRSLPLCGGRAVAADYAKWLFCAPCALAQEVRTGNFYDVEGDGLYEKEVPQEENPTMAPLEREGMVAESVNECVVTVDVPPVPVRVQEVQA